MPKKILVADDEESVRFMIQSVLEMKGFSVVLASDGAQCLHRIQDDNPDLVLLDIDMPNVGGMSAIKMIKAMCTIPVIVVSGRATEENRRLAVKFGADDFISKPFGADQLGDRVAKHLVTVGLTDLVRILHSLRDFDEGLSLLASVGQASRRRVYSSTFEGLQIRVITPDAFSPQTVPILTSEEASESFVVLADMSPPWKCLWPSRKVAPVNFPSSNKFPGGTPV